MSARFALLATRVSYYLPGDLGDDPGADGAAAFADREAHPVFERDRGDQLDLHPDVVPGHHHLDPVRELDRAGHVGGPDVELRPIAVEERGVPPALFFA